MLIERGGCEEEDEQRGLVGPILAGGLPSSFPLPAERPHLRSQAHLDFVPVSLRPPLTRPSSLSLSSRVRPPPYIASPFTPPLTPRRVLPPISSCLLFHSRRVELRRILDRAGARTRLRCLPSVQLFRSSPGALESGRGKTPFSQTDSSDLPIPSFPVQSDPSPSSGILTEVETTSSSCESINTARRSSLRVCGS